MSYKFHYINQQLLFIELIYQTIMKFSVGCLLTLSLSLVASCSSDLSRKPVAQTLEMQSQLVGIKQASSLTIFDEHLVILAQKSHGFFTVKLQEAKAALMSQQPLSNLTFVAFEGALPEKASWEAISFSQQNGKWQVFLSYENSADEGETDDHYLYRADVLSTDQGLSIANMERVSEALPENQSITLSQGQRDNLGYEAVSWLADEGKLLALAEMDEHSGFTFSFKKPQTFNLARHGLRISDMTEPFGESCFVVSSFCWQGDPELCDKNQQSSKVSINLLKWQQGKFQLVAQQDISDSVLSAPAIDGSGNGEFNLEGVALHDNVLYLVNDNHPGKDIGTLLKHMPLPKSWRNQCNI